MSRLGAPQSVPPSGLAERQAGFSPAVSALHRQAARHPSRVAWRLHRLACGALVLRQQPGDEWDVACARLIALAAEIGQVRP